MDYILLPILVKLESRYTDRNVLHCSFSNYPNLKTQLRTLLPMGYFQTNLTLYN